MYVTAFWYATSASPRPCRPTPSRIAFIIVNRETVETSFLFFEVRTPHWVSMVVTLSLGIGIGWFLSKKDEATSTWRNRNRSSRIRLR